ncbi:MAG: phosphoketolase family protein [Candidatus Peregrinibacteria bacterium]|nr:phosphoketolase family protein [Candidatus Peregrinibacteria bacterium]MDZ4244776.1 phosphoketolase family protein [Candidatus Gracilibacteria bacterium]
MANTDKKALAWMGKYLRYVDYIAAGALYLRENHFLRREMTVENLKPRILGHWGTVPGLNFIYANMNYLICKHKCNMMFVTGPGHGAPATHASLIAEGTMEEFYPCYTRDEVGTGKLMHDFSWPHSPFPSHITPTVPGSLLEGGELGYSLSTAFGAALDNPDLIVAVAVGDGESESGPLSAAWNSNKFLNPKTSGAVLPIVHINGFKISNPTIYSTMSDKELTNLFTGLGYEPIIVDGNPSTLPKKMIAGCEKAYQLIRKTQTAARKSKKPLLKPKWPVILLRSPKGWGGVQSFHGHAIEGSFHAHGIPFGHPQTNKDEFNVVKKWLEKYKINELVDGEGRPKKEVLEFVPKGKYRMGMNPHAVGGNFFEKLKVPNLKKLETKIKKRGEGRASSMIQAGKYFSELIKKNPKNFRMFCPDELESNLLGGVFEATERGYVWPIPKNAEHVAYDGRVFEMLSEHTLEGWMQGYTLSGRHGVFVTYEAFAIIIASMVDQHAKFLKQSFHVPWRKPVPTMTYILSSLSWRQDHNGYSHQNPSFVSNVLLKHPEFCQVYYPPDANSMLVALEEIAGQNDSIAVIVAGKRLEEQWLSLDEARKQAKEGIGIWEFVGGREGTKKPDVVMASAGDYITKEAIMAVEIAREFIPEIKIRYVNVSELTGMCLGDRCPINKKELTEKKINSYFTEDKPVVFAYHGYANDIEQILWPYESSKRFTLHGYSEFGSTTTPFDLKVSNKVDCYDLAIDLIKQAAKTNKAVAKKADKVCKEIYGKIREHQKYIYEHGEDPQDIQDM